MLDSGKEVEAFNQAALTNKCLQFSNGAMYPVAGMPLWEPVHDLKLDALEDILDEAQGQPLLCCAPMRTGQTPSASWTGLPTSPTQST